LTAIKAHLANLPDSGTDDSVTIDGKLGDDVSPG
jgi:hypothetical protein